MATASAEVEHPPPPSTGEEPEQSPIGGMLLPVPRRCWTGGMAGSTAPLKDAGHPARGQRWQNRFRNIG